MARADAVNRRAAARAAAVLAGALAALVAAPPAALAATTPDASTRVYVARLRASAGIDEAITSAIEEAILVAAKKSRKDLTVLGRSDVAALSDLVAEQAAAGCDAESCASEIADALGAPQIVTGKLARVGSTWILSLTRLERGSLSVLARESVEKGDAESLIGAVPQVVAALFSTDDDDGSGARADDGGARDRRDGGGGGVAKGGGGGGAGLAIGGGVAVGAGVVLAGAGAGLLYWSTLLYADAQKANDKGDTARVQELTAQGEPLFIGGWTAVGVGAAAAVAGGVLLALGVAAAE